MGDLTNEQLQTRLALTEVAYGDVLERIAELERKGDADRQLLNEWEVERLQLKARIAELERPVSMLLFCPACNLQHVDVDEWATTRTHRSHLCKPEDGGCGHVWRSADVATVGVSNIKTKGERDGVPAPQMPPPAIIMAEAERLLREAGVERIDFTTEVTLEYAPHDPDETADSVIDGAPTLAEAYASLAEERARDEERTYG